MNQQLGAKLPALCPGGVKFADASGAASGAQLVCAGASWRLAPTAVCDTVRA
jgi:hypothetical protein